MIYIVNGFPGSGKDEFCQKVVSLTTPLYGCIMSSVDLVKELAKSLGWNGEKTPKNRKFLSDLKDLLTEWNDIPIKDIEGRINDFLYDIRYYGLDEKETAIFIMCREPKEIEKMCKKFQAKSILIRRSAVESLNQSNHADSDIFNYKYDIEIDNNGTLLDLAYQVLDFVEKEKLHIDHWDNLKIDLFGNFIYNNGKEDKKGDINEFYYKRN